MKNTLLLLPLLLLPLAGCDDVEDGHDHDHDHGAITTVTLSFAPQGGGDSIEFTWSDPELDGSPDADDIVLMDADDYDVSVSFLNGQEDPAEDVTSDIADQDSEHQIFFTGSGVQGPATGSNAAAVVEHAYADADAGDLPVGLENSITTAAVGDGEVMVTLRHMPPENDEPVKVEGLAAAVAAGGFAAIGGGNDVQVTFNIEVQ
jgi:hypothetical protein